MTPQYLAKTMQTTLLRAKILAIQEAVMEVCGLREESEMKVRAFCARARRAELVIPRQLAMYLCGILLPQATEGLIAQMFGSEHQGTVRNAKKRMEARLLEQTAAADRLRHQMEQVRTRFQRPDAEGSSREGSEGSEVGSEGKTGKREDLKTRPASLK